MITIVIIIIFIGYWKYFLAWIAKLRIVLKVKITAADGATNAAFVMKPKIKKQCQRNSVMTYILKRPVVFIDWQVVILSSYWRNQKFSRIWWLCK